jgi:hypothetical protein
VRFHQLDPWQELFGIFQDITFDEDVVIATISGYTLRYPIGTPEAVFLIRNLKKERIGSEVGILNAEKELRIRWPDDQVESNEPSRFWKW